MTSFAGWQMPLRYTSETAEHLAVRSAAGLFDLSHMGEIMVTGPGAGPALDYALVGQLSALAPGRARYTMICAPDGGVLDDLVVYRPSEQEFMVVANASNTSTVYRELASRAFSVGADAEVEDATGNYALIAVQGPASAGILGPLTEVDLSALKYYTGAFGDVAGRLSWVARTGYTGEDGFEIFCAPADAKPIWEALAGSGDVPAAGLAARDTLRLEAGMPLYGNELGPDVTPYEPGLGRVVRLDKPGDFVGRAALEEHAAEEPRHTLIGLVSETRRVPRHGYAVLAGGEQVGSVTSGAPSPTLGKPIAMAYVEGSHTGPFWIDVRGKEEPAAVTELPFYKRGK